MLLSTHRSGTVVLLYRYCGTVSGVRKLTREEANRDPNAIAKARIVYDDGETHWGLVRREQRE